ncbi:probable serine/threonine-protein kinase drkD [Nasonia vitripennis]|uniref:Uncharacterized protein n=1 Tax=Nasonia vitripennis TaxID=7425 RepID=A0A7M7PYZ7_NASVI|nr:probable serine/threonine-protein kinase drkD [Nasonia vitripennis]
MIPDCSRTVAVPTIPVSTGISAPRKPVLIVQFEQFEQFEQLNWNCSNCSNCSSSSGTSSVISIHDLGPISMRKLNEDKGGNEQKKRASGEMSPKAGTSRMDLEATRQVCERRGRLQLKRTDSTADKNVKIVALNMSSSNNNSNTKNSSSNNSDSSSNNSNIDNNINAIYQEW